LTQVKRRPRRATSSSRELASGQLEGGPASRRDASPGPRRGRELAPGAPRAVERRRGRSSGPIPVAGGSG